jgi:hypothetical protein
VNHNHECAIYADWNHNTALRSAGSPGEVQLKFTNYLQQGDSMALVFNRAQKAIQSVQVSSYLNNNPSDAVTFSAQLAKLPDEQPHVHRHRVSLKHSLLIIHRSSFVCVEASQQK